MPIQACVFALCKKMNKLYMCIVLFPYIVKESRQIVVRLLHDLISTKLHRFWPKYFTFMWTKEKAK